MRLLQHMNSVINTRLTDMAEVHRAVLEAFVGLFAVAEDDNSLSQLELCLSSANGEWLDIWASYFLVNRYVLVGYHIPQEDKLDITHTNGDKQTLVADYRRDTDAVLRQRIIDSVKQPKVTIPAIQMWIANYLNVYYDPMPRVKPEDILIIENYENTLVYSKGNTYSENFRYTGGRYGRCIIQIIIPSYLNLTQELRDLVLEIKAAGVQVWWLNKPLDEYDVIDNYSKHKIFRHYYIKAWFLHNLNNEEVLTHTDYWKGQLSEFRSWSGGQKAWIAWKNQSYAYKLPHRFTSWQSPLFDTDILEHHFESLDAVTGSIEDYVVKINAAVEVNHTPHTGKPWTPPPFVKYMISFDSKGGTPVESQQILYDTLATKPDTPEYQTHERWPFRGWYKDHTVKIPWDFNMDTVTEDTTLYAGWYNDGLGVVFHEPPEKPDVPIDNDTLEFEPLDEDIENKVIRHIKINHEPAIAGRTDLPSYTPNQGAEIIKVVWKPSEAFKSGHYYMVSFWLKVPEDWTLIKDNIKASVNDLSTVINGMTFQDPQTTLPWVDGKFWEDSQTEAIYDGNYIKMAVIQVLRDKYTPRLETYVQVVTQILVD